MVNVQDVGGELSIRSTVGKGTLLRLVVNMT
jgi:chemotaxis protein histidine kinase CheA